MAKFLIKNKDEKLDYVLAFGRLGLGWVFLWAFIDKLFGLGFTTCLDNKTGTVTQFCENAWASGGSPTSGFLKFATQGPFENIFGALAGNVFVDWVFMLGLLGIGVALLLGIGVKIAVASGVVMLFMMYLAAMPPEHNPLVDDHLLYPILLLAIALRNDKQKLGLGQQWQDTKLVKKYPYLA